MLYIDNVIRSIYKRLLNDNNSKEALEAYCTKKQLLGSTRALLGRGEFDKNILSINYMYSSNIHPISIRKLEEYDLPSVNNLYINLGEINISTVTKAYIIVLSIWIYLILGARKGTYVALIDKGIEVNLIS
jgi:hypothetical protein